MDESTEIEKTEKTEISAPTSKKAGKIPKGFKPWKPGESGNPGGRPKGLMTLVREKSSDGDEIVEILLSIARGTLSVRVGDSDFPPTVKERMEAIRELLDRGWGRPTESLEIAGIADRPVTVEVGLAREKLFSRIAALVSAVPAPKVLP
jgi:hypothetical protein